MKKIGSILLFLSGLCIALPVLAHSGRTNAYGCHNDYIHGGYHCHNSGYSSYDSDDVVVSTPVVTKKYYYVSVISYSCYAYVDTYDAIQNFLNIYNDELGRNPRCDELNFHIDHVTPHDRLRTFLRSTDEYDIVHSTEINGCKVYDKQGIDHLNMVNATYEDVSGRSPTCQELSAHAGWATPYTRLYSWLDSAYRYQVKIKVLDNGAPVKNTKITIRDSDDIIVLTGKTNKKGVFKTDQLPADKKYQFSITLDEIEYSLIKKVVASQSNSILLNF